MDFVLVMVHHQHMLKQFRSTTIPMQTPAPNSTDDGMLSSLNLSATGITVDRSIDLTVAEQAAATAQHATCLAHACKYTHHTLMLCFSTIKKYYLGPKLIWTFLFLNTKIMARAVSSQSN